MVVFSCCGLRPRARPNLVVRPEEDDNEGGRVGLHPTLLAQGKDGIKHAECISGRIARYAAILDVGPACVGVGQEAGIPEEGWVPTVLRETVACGGGRERMEKEKDEDDLCGFEKDKSTKTLAQRVLV